jgi:hypothetical protein
MQEGRKTKPQETFPLIDAFLQRDKRDTRLPGESKNEGRGLASLYEADQKVSEP